MANEIVVHTCRFIETHVVEVKGLKKGTKIPREYTVHFSRRGEVKFGHCWTPLDDDSYLADEMIPLPVREAAIEAYRKG